MKIKRIIHLPGLLLLGLCGVLCSLLAWPEGDEWCYQKFNELRRKS